MFEEWLRDAAPLRAARVLHHIRDVRGGTMNQTEWSKRMTGTGPYAEVIANRFQMAAKRLGYGARVTRLDVSALPPSAETGRPAEFVLSGFPTSPSHFVGPSLSAPPAERVKPCGPLSAPRGGEG